MTRGGRRIDGQETNSPRDMEVARERHLQTGDDVVRACSVVQKGAGARCCVVCGVGKERPMADGRIEAADFVVDREASNGWVVCSAREIKKCVLPLRGVAAYIASSDGGLTASDVSKTEK